MRALRRFIDWMRGYQFVDRRGILPPGLQIQYHGRSDEHSKRLGELILDDLLETCPILRAQAGRGEIGYSINHLFQWPNGKAKTLDLAVGIPLVHRGPPPDGRIHRLASQTRRGKTAAESFSRLLIACEEKAVMTEHGKSQPRIYSELNDSHTIVHTGGRDTIAAGITMLNVASTFISPLRQRVGKPIEISHHRQPQVTARMVSHLRKLPIRDDVNSVGLDAYCTFVVDVNNQGNASLHLEPPAPQAGDPDHYDTFLDLICRIYTRRFNDLTLVPEPTAHSVEESLFRLARGYPGLLEAVAQWAVDRQLTGARELQNLVRLIASEIDGRDI